jgi:3-polyprenyl-4-hydroxybenzoate decarboxylase
MPGEVVLSEVHGLPMPADAEIVIEGEMAFDSEETLHCSK